MKDKCLISFSGGETSAFMINYLIGKYPDVEYKIVFANTGEENEETLKFVEECSVLFNREIVWVEYDRKDGKPSFKVVNFVDAYRSHDIGNLENRFKDHPFRKAIERFGIPSQNNFMCTRELKERPILRYMRSIGWLPRHYDLAIGIRADEIDRIGQYYYPLVKAGITKQMVNAFWDKMPFRLQLKGYQGNCKTCWKKSFRKLGTIAAEDETKFNFFKIMEEDYGNFIPATWRRNIDLPRRFFNKSTGVDDVLKIPNKPGFQVAIDDSIDTSYQVTVLHDGTELDINSDCLDSCEPFK